MRKRKRMPDGNSEILNDECTTHNVVLKQCDMEELVQTLVDAGILTKKHKLAKYYREHN
jgi:hypothetical protein